ncbi:MAG: CBS domain-containing protein, partial [Candidatus Omnitrophota bacterium]
KVENEKTCFLDDVKRLIIVDNRHKSRIGIAASLLGKKGIKVHIYDHHPRTRFDIKGDLDIFKEVGATVTILVERLIKKGKLSLTPLEATLMLLGIYEETGYLSYRTTTKLDIDVVSKLLEQGANLNAVSSYLNRELSEHELTALIKLLESIRSVDVNGVDVAFAEFDASSFDGETGTVVHKLQEVENYPVLFAIFKYGNKLKILARSRIESVDVNKLLSHMGGAGHSSAASARLVDKDADRARKEILQRLKKTVRPDIDARQIMSFPVKTVSQEDTVKEVWEKLDRFGHKGAPVLSEDGKIVGMVTFGDLKKALKHDMGHSRVKGYMASRVVTVAPQTPLHVLEKIMLEKDKGRIPVVDEDNKLVGIVTRTDVLKKVHSALFLKGADQKAKATNLASKMKESLPGKLMTFIRTISREADARGINVFLVGGFVRDILLGVKNYDLDIVVEGDAIEFGRILGSSMGGSLVVHKKFGTATLVKDWPKWLGPSLHPDNKFKIDIATARKEIYEKPAALPTVEFSSLREDLYRRDFTINAMAVNINKKNFGLFLDFFGGRNDLEKGIIRILHDKSFIDDPTRIFRAVRFEQRFGFNIEKHTEYLIQHAVKREMFRRTEKQRIRDELILILKEKDPDKAVFRMRELHELRFIHPGLVLPRSVKKRFDEIKKHVKWYDSSDNIRKRRLDVWLMNFMVLLDSLSVKDVEDVLKGFVFTKSETIRVMSYKEKGDRAIRRLSSKKKMKSSSIYKLLEPFSHEVTLCLMARTGSKTARNRIRKFFTEYNGTRLKISGSYIMKEGIAPGPRYKKLLDTVLYRKLDGKLATKQDEIDCLRKIIERQKRKKRKK